VSYGQLGILLEMLWRGEKTAFSKCDFCQTLNHIAAPRCDGCSGKLPASYAQEHGARKALRDVAGKVQGNAQGEAEGKGRGRRRPASHELTNLMVWVLAMPLVLFVGFTCWQQSRLHEGRSANLQSEQAASTVAASPQALADGSGAPARTAILQALPAIPLQSVLPVTQASAAGLDGARPGTNAAPTAVASIAAASEPREEIILGPATPANPTNAARPSHPRLTMAALPGNGRDPTAGCEGEMFLLRAVCENRRCAEPQNAKHPRCLSVQHQRRIDEARRNPTLVG
jgi:hypothetical protein